MLEDLKRLDPFRAKVRTWLSENLPADWQRAMLGAGEDHYVSFQRTWFRRLVDAGYGAPHWPREWGGSGFSFEEQIVLYEEIARAGAPRLTLYFVSLHQLAGTMLHCTEEQRGRYLPAVLTGDEVWCQGFSEPGAGSDLASLRTRAIRRGSHYVVNGQKIWSSNAHLARYCLLLARTDPAVSKARGISFFILDMSSPGVSLRPIKQMTGASDFNEIFLDDVEIPAENLVGSENEGWAVAQSTLSSERGLSILELAERMRHAFRLLLAEARQAKFGAATAYDDDEIRRRLVEIYSRIEALRLLVNEQLSHVLHGAAVGVEPSIIKLYYSELLRDFTELAVEIRGIDSQYLQAILMGGANETGYWMKDFLYSWAWTISGGSSEIQRNIIAERGLKLPREPQLAQAVAGRGGR